MNESIDIKRIRAQAKVFRNTKMAKSQSSVYPSGWEAKTEAQKAVRAYQPQPSMPCQRHFSAAFSRQLKPGGSRDN